MKVLLESGFSELDGDVLYVRDGAFATAGDDDSLMVWDTEQAFEDNGNEVGVFFKRHLQPLELPQTVEEDHWDDDGGAVVLDDDIEELLASDPSIVNEVKRNPDTDFRAGDRVIVNLQATVHEVNPDSITILFQQNVEDNDFDKTLVLDYSNSNVRDIKLLPRPVEHPPAGSIVSLTLDNAIDKHTGQYILADNGYYYGIGVFSGNVWHKDNGDIKKVEVLNVTNL